MGCTSSTAMNRSPEYPCGHPNFRGVEDWTTLENSEKVVYHQRFPKAVLRGNYKTSRIMTLYTTPPLLGKARKLIVSFMVTVEGLRPGVTSAEVELQLLDRGTVKKTCPICPLNTSSLLVSIEHVDTEDILSQAERGSVFKIVVSITSTPSSMHSSCNYAIILTNFNLDLYGADAPPVLTLPFEESVRMTRKEHEQEQAVFVLRSGRVWAWPLPPGGLYQWTDTPPLIHVPSKIVVSFTFSVISKSPNLFHFASARLSLAAMRSERTVSSIDLLFVNRKNYNLKENHILQIVLDQSNHQDKSMANFFASLEKGDRVVIRRELVGYPTTKFVVKHFLLELYPSPASEGQACAKPVRLGGRMLLSPNAEAGVLTMVGGRKMESGSGRRVKAMGHRLNKSSVGRRGEGDVDISADFYGGLDALDDPLKGIKDDNDDQRGNEDGNGGIGDGDQYIEDDYFYGDDNTDDIAYDDLGQADFQEAIGSCGAFDSGGGGGGGDFAGCDGGGYAGFDGGNDGGGFGGGCDGGGGDGGGGGGDGGGGGGGDGGGGGGGGSCD
eukprot:gene6107-6724_t